MLTYLAVQIALGERIQYLNGILQLKIWMLSRRGFGHILITMTTMISMNDGGVIRKTGTNHCVWSNNILFAYSNFSSSV